MDYTKIHIDSKVYDLSIQYKYEASLNTHVRKEKKLYLSQQLELQK